MNECQGRTFSLNPDINNINNKQRGMASAALQAYEEAKLSGFDPSSTSKAKAIITSLLDLALESEKKAQAIDKRFTISPEKKTQPKLKPTKPLPPREPVLPPPPPGSKQPSTLPSSSSKRKRAASDLSDTHTSTSTPTSTKATRKASIGDDDLMLEDIIEGKRERKKADFDVSALLTNTKPLFKVGDLVDVCVTSSKFTKKIRPGSILKVNPPTAETNNRVTYDLTLVQGDTLYGVDRALVEDGEDKDVR